jgi:hypothetical protein
MDTRPPHLQNVLASVVRGRVARLCLRPAQSKILRDPEGRIALDVLRHLLGGEAVGTGALPAHGAGIPGACEQAGLSRGAEALPADGQAVVCLGRGRALRSLPAALP